ncbi:MAG TPA: penicillin-binding transpeptidase domain-containing protein [Actinocrinis sp.]|nr:penicillin-binding transpeptidase domain-containing protein [Actinocrinis sp.]
MTEPTGSTGGPGRDSGQDGDDPFAGLFRDQPRAEPRGRDETDGGPGAFGSDPRWSGPPPQRPQSQQPAPAQQPWTPGPASSDEPEDSGGTESGSGLERGDSRDARDSRDEQDDRPEPGATIAHWTPGGPPSVPPSAPDGTERFDRPRSGESPAPVPGSADAPGAFGGRERERERDTSDDRAGAGEPGAFDRTVAFTPPGGFTGPNRFAPPGNGDRGGDSELTRPASGGGPSFPTQPFAAQSQQPQQPQRPLMHEETGITPIIRPEYEDEDDYRRAGWEPSGAQESRRGRKKLVAVGGLGTVAVVAVAVVLLTQGGGASPGAAGAPQRATPTPTPTPTVGFAPSGASPVEDTAQTAAAFFKAWEAGDYQAAANFTDDPAGALTALQSYKSDLGASSLTITPAAATADDDAATTAPATKSPKGAKATPTVGPSATPSAGASGAGVIPATTAPSGSQDFSVRVVVTPPAGSAGGASGASVGSTTAADPTGSATASGSGTGAGPGSGAGTSAPSTATWTYTSNLTAYEQQGRWYVKWTPSVLAPNLSATDHLATVPVSPGAAEVTDASGGNLTAYSDPGISSIISYLKQHVPAGSGTPGVAVELVDSSGKAVSGSEDVIKPPVNVASIATTIDPHVEQLALRAVQHKVGSSMVVVRPSTGAILAVANNDGGKDDALASREAPGSTMKIVTAAALFNYGVLTPESPVACPPTFTVQGVIYHNSEGDQEPAGTPFQTDFAQSCNNAFDSQYLNLGGLRLEGTAVHTFGLNQPWNIGLGPATYFAMPTDAGDESGSELAQEAFGQGKVSASPLSMASVAATVQTGSFHQPYLVATITDKVTATPMLAGTQADLKKVMRAVISSPVGTAYGIPFASDVYGKTGTAEHGPENMSPNAWFTAVDPNQDIAACALVLDNTLNQDNYGATNAAPEVLSLFNGL